MKHRAQIFCLAVPLSSLASSWNIVELSKQGVLRSVPATMRDEGCPRCLLCKASLAVVTPGQDVLESRLLKPSRRTDVRSCRTLAEPTNFQKKFSQKKNKTTNQRNPGPRILPLRGLEARSLEPSLSELPGFGQRLATSVPPAQRIRSRNSRVHRTPLY